jgi:predicted RNA-binding protein associated with RNAse of E/G family
MEVAIHYHRFSASGTTIFRETFVSDDGRRLTTHSVLPLEEQQGLSQHMWGQQMLPEGYLIGSLRKYYFYDEYFDILAVYGLDGELAGYYSDIATPLRKVGDVYYLDDLYLDYWLVPGQPPRAMDEDEFEAACAQGLLTPEQMERARATFARLWAEIAAGIFPQRYIQP